MNLTRRLHAQRGFSFIEIIVVMGIISILAGLSVVVVQMMAKKGPKMKTGLLLNRVSTSVEAWKGKFGAYPPSEVGKIFLVTNLPTTKISRLPNLNNQGIRSLYICLNLTAFGKAVELNNEDLTPEEEMDDALDRPVEGLTSPKLWEIVDAYRNPLVYINSMDYLSYDKNPPTYIAKDAEGQPRPVNPKPWKSGKTEAFEQARSYQLFSMGEDGTPNTDDDLKSWTTD